MKYCSKCGKPLEDDAIFCIGCGRLVGNEYNSSQIYQTDNTYQSLQVNDISTQSSLAKTATALMILGTVLSSIYTLGIALTWCLPMTISYSKQIKHGKKVDIGFKVCSLLFVSTIAGILMLCDEK